MLNRNFIILGCVFAAIGALIFITNTTQFVDATTGLEVLDAQNNLKSVFSKQYGPYIPPTDIYADLENKRMIGGFIFLIGGIISGIGFALRKKPQKTKACPSCAETVMAEAIKCRHCGDILS